MKNLDGLKQKLTGLLREKGIRNQKVLDAFLKVPRHLFVDEAFRQEAYADKALPIGNSQTISQPYIVALMTEALGLGEDDKILEVGTGSGFQTAILAQFSRRVYTVERDALLAEKARTRLREMGNQNVMFKIGDGTQGWTANAPYDKIIVTAGAREIPPSLLNQLAEGGRMVIPTGGISMQELLVVDKIGGQAVTKNICDVVFVPLVGKEGWETGK